MSKGGNKQTQTQTYQQSNTIDPATQRYIDSMRQQAQGAVNEIQNSGPFFIGPSAEQADALRRIAAQKGSADPRYDQFFSAAGGLTSHLGEPIENQITKFMNPYTHEVVDATRGEFDFLRDKANTAANQQATLEGAFGGSRHGAMQGARLGELDRAQASKVAELMSGGYSDAVRNAFTYRGEGLQALGMMPGAIAAGQAADSARDNALFSGYSNMRDIEERRLSEPLYRNQAVLNFLNNSVGPYSTTAKGNSQAVTQTQQDIWGQLLGAGLTIGSMFVPGGGAALPAVSRGLAGGGNSNAIRGGYQLPPGGIFQ